MKKSEVVVGLSDNFDNFEIKDFANIGIAEIREKCTFLAPTPVIDLHVGVTFTETPNRERLVDVSFVQETFQGKRRVPIGNFAHNYDALNVYATIGMITAQFMQQMITWGELKKAVSELITIKGEDL